MNCKQKSISSFFQNQPYSIKKAKTAVYILSADDLKSNESLLLRVIHTSNIKSLRNI